MLQNMLPETYVYNLLQPTLPVTPAIMKWSSHNTQQVRKCFRFQLLRERILRNTFYRHECHTGAEYAISNGEKWLKDNQKTAMGWMNQQNADAMLGLRLGRMSMYRPGNCDFNTLSKSVEYDLLSALMR